MASVEVFAELLGQGDVTVLRTQLAEVAELAAEAILLVYEKDGDIRSSSKEDDSPITAADLAASDVINRELRARFPDIPIVSEEALPETRQRRGWNTFWCVDPLDGTKEFIARNDQFTVNIALIHKHCPILGVVGVPAQHSLFFGGAGLGAWVRQPRSFEWIDIRAREFSTSQNQLTMLASVHHRSEEDRQLVQLLSQRFNELQNVSVGSALKFCWLAEGKADLYPRMGPTSEWDVAAGHAVLEGAGGAVVKGGGEPLRYNTEDSLLNPRFMAVADKRVLEEPMIQQFLETLSAQRFEACIR